MICQRALKELEALAQHGMERHIGFQEAVVVEHPINELKDAEKYVRSVIKSQMNFKLKDFDEHQFAQRIDVLLVNLMANFQQDTTKGHVDGHLWPARLARAIEILKEILRELTILQEKIQDMKNWLTG